MMRRSEQILLQDNRIPVHTGDTRGHQGKAKVPFTLNRDKIA